MNKIIKRLRKRSRPARSKRGSTLVELVAVIAILAIISSSCLSGMFAMTKVAAHGNMVSQSQRTCAVLNQQISVYANTATQLEAYTSKPTFTKYDSGTHPDGFMNAKLSCGDKVDMFVYADSSRDNTIVFASFDPTSASVSGYNVKEITTVENVKQVDFKLKRLNIAPGTDKYLLEFTITTIYGTQSKPYSYQIDSGVVLNNFTSSSKFDGLSLNNVFSITTKNATTAASTNHLRLRTTNRESVNRG
ncbi:MAG: type II secretion system protein [Acutalibacteraceae bacterium]